MSGNPKVVNAFRVTRALGIPDAEIKPVLKGLLRMYDKKWELIEEDNYRTLIDAYFESKENKVGPIICSCSYSHTHTCDRV